MSNSRLFCWGFVIGGLLQTVMKDAGTLTALAAHNYWEAKLCAGILFGCTLVAGFGDRHRKTKGAYHDPD